MTNIIISKHEFTPHVRMTTYGDSYLYIECTCEWKTNEYDSQKFSLKQHWEAARIHFENVTGNERRISKKPMQRVNAPRQDEQLFEW